MNGTSLTPLQSDIRTTAEGITRLVQDGRYSDALDTVKHIKLECPRNIFVIALEKQLERLLALMYDPLLSDPDQQNEIVGSIPTLVQNAVSQMKLSDGLNGTQSSPVVEERDVALTQLKSEYLQLADRHIEKEEYQDALREVKRALILDPNNDAAREYERRIRELMRNRSPQTERPPTRQIARPIPPRTSSHVNVNGQVERPATVSVQAGDDSGAVQRPQSFKILIVGLALAVVAATVIYFVFKTDTTNEGATSVTPEKSVQAVLEDKPKVRSDSAGPVTTTTLQADTMHSAVGSQTSALKETTSVPPMNQAAVRPSNESIAKVVEPVPRREGKTSTTRPEPKVDLPAQLKEEEDVPVAPVPRKQSRTPALTKLEVATHLPPVTSKPDPAVKATYTERRPEVVRLTKPQFPEAARKTRLDGEVLVKVLINTEGKPVRATIIKSSSPLFNDAVIDAVMHSQYSPGVMPTGPVTTWLTLPFTFKNER